MSNSLINPDLAPTTPGQRTWSMWNIAALWIGMAVCITTYNIASGMVEQGMEWWQATLTVLLGNLIVLVPMILNGHPGTKYGIPFPVLVRSSFGTRGSNIAALARAVVACGWFGIQTWIGGEAIYHILIALNWINPEVDADKLAFLGITLNQLACFLAFWLINLAIILKGIDCIKWLEAWSAPFLLAVGVALLIWAASRVENLSDMFHRPANLPPGKPFSQTFIPNLTAMVGYWATLSLNIPDFTRYCRSQRDQAMGQLLGLPTTMALFCFIGVLVTFATGSIYGELVWDPVKLVARFGSPLVVIVSLLALMIATLTTNIAANVVSPANDFSNLWPRGISFRIGGIITCIIGVLMMPWKVLESTHGYIFTWLIGYGALLGPIAGIMLCDYYLVRRTRLNREALYDPDGEYAGVNIAAVIALLLAVLPNLPGFINSVTGRTHAAAVAAELARQVAAAEGKSLPALVHPIFPRVFDALYDYAWFIGLTLAVVIYFALMHGRAKSATAENSQP